jgi:hypothetical protein
MPRSLLLLLVTVAGCDGRHARPLPAVVHAGPVDEVRAAILGRDKDLTRVAVFPVRGSPDRFVAICDSEYQWCGGFECVRIRDGQVQPAAQVDVTPTEQSIRHVRGFVDPHLNSTLVEVVGMTHMGHGDYYLYEWKDDSLRLLFQTFVLDCHHDGNLIRGGCLRTEYRDLDGDGRADLAFSGTVEEFSDDVGEGEVAVRSYPCRKVFHWNEPERRFVEDVSLRVGFESYSGRS